MEEYGKTVIYIKNEPFQECINVVLNIPNEKLKNFDEIISIKQTIDIYNELSDEHNDVEHFNISPEEEFLMHCSNLQAWSENDYDICILHSNLSFPF
ncbi:MAG: hypothetical protein ACTSPW_00030 [Promethearchaeota archaeon]